MSQGDKAFQTTVSGLFRLVLDPEAVVDVMAALDTLADEGPSDEELKELRKQVELAETISQRVHVRSANSMPMAYLLLSRTQHILDCADPGRLFQHIVVSAAPGDRLQLRDASAQREFEHVISTLKPGGLKFMPMQPDQDAPLLTIAVARTQEQGAGAEAPQYIVASPHSSSWSDELEQALREFKLTNAEVRVLRALRTDQTAADLAEHLGVAESTVRTQIKALLAKFGVSRQAELVRFREEAIRLSGSIREQLRIAVTDRAGADALTFPSGRARPPRRLMTLENGRRISYREFGRSGRKTLVVLHGAHSGSMIPEGYRPGAETLHQRLIAPDRPGFGESSPSHPDLSITDAAHEISELLDRLGVHEFSILALAAGTATGLELARINERAISLNLCSPHFGASPLPGARRGFGLFVRESLLQQAPWLIERVSRVAWGGMSWERLKAMAPALFRRSPADLRLLETTDLATYFADVALDALQSPPDGQMWEARALRKYRPSVEGVEAPITLFFGSDDIATDKAGMVSLFTTSAPPRVETLSRGQLFYYEHWLTVLRHAAAAASRPAI